MPRPQILCISLSPIYRDARVLRQISVLSEFGDVVTVGYGHPPDGAVEHIEIPSHLSSLPRTWQGVALLALHQWGRVELKAPAVVRALELLRERRFDLVVANEARVLALAHHVAGGSPVWGDMHEWAPGERTHILSWRLLIAPFMTHLCNTYLNKTQIVTTVSDSIVELYDSTFGTNAVLMRNSTPWQDLEPSPVTNDHIKLVHCGAAVHGRSLETMIDAVLQLDARYSLDFYLVPGGDNGRYLDELRARAAASERIRFNEPVRPDELARTLNVYDVGVFWIPPTHVNARFTLPNKLFDFVQARLAVAVSPTLEMARVVNKYGLGIVGDGFEVAQCAAALSSLTPDAIAAGKAASNIAAHDLSFEVDAAVARDLLSRILA